MGLAMAPSGAAADYDPAIQTGPETLTFADLDAANKEHPVFTRNASGHLAYANRKAFEVVGVHHAVAR